MSLKLNVVTYGYFDDVKLIKRMSDVVKINTELYLQEFLKQKVLPITPVDETRVNKTYNTTKEMSSNAKVVIENESEKNGIPLSYTAYVHFGEDPVSRLYTVKQHEMNWFTHEPPTRDKFLQIPFEEVLINDEGLIKRLGSTINSLF